MIKHLFIQGDPALEALAWRVAVNAIIDMCSQDSLTGCAFSSLRCPKSIEGLCTDRCSVSLAQPVLRCLSSYGARAIAVEISADRMIKTPMLPPFVCL